MTSSPLTYSLRPYQQEAVNATISHFRKSHAPAVIVLPTGAGKSLVIAELARLAKGSVLVLAHVKELVEQNCEKYRQYDDNVSIFSAGLSEKNSSAKIVFGSIQSVARNLDQFSRIFSLVIIDECHRVSMNEDAQYWTVIHHLKSHNEHLKILGLTATPYRTGSGWIYQAHQPLNTIRTTEETPFSLCIYELTLKKMINDGYLCKPILLNAPVAFYDFDKQSSQSSTELLTHSLETDEESLNAIVRASHRATAKICAQIISLSNDRKGVMIFAATVEHAKEVYGYLPKNNSAIVLGDMSNKARDSVIQAFKSQAIKYLVNVAVLTTGFDAPHVDVIALLRSTQSASLFQQIIGRGLRLSPNKTDCLILDYAQTPFDLYQPEINDKKPSKDSVVVEVPCPLCNHTNQFWGIVDNDGDLVEHYGRRCQGIIDIKTNYQDLSQQRTLQQCSYRFRFKQCPNCNEENDIAARRCTHCNHVFIDPDKRLKEALQLKDIMVIRCGGLSLSKVQLSKGTRLQVTYHDEDGAEVSEFFAFDNPKQVYAFQKYFVRLHWRPSNISIESAVSTMNTVDAAILHSHQFRAPDFVIARQRKYSHKREKASAPKQWEVMEKLFDYEGPHRKAFEEF
ncbi:DEAD/DEAH box helicase [Marinibactrum halimedae]|uniref:ATP-dependent helicase n=1 Tax=Marinibactrum halimedae TaxID=1444977 RepID=A0AA37T4K1_9GAMM|nr:DEAD/DEAH box helicase [Marinibactrum halimedae]MCD9458130.1 DEAD/DEAH box helicase family protein [Marinibactrum halimedae]GLS25063.1 ATP-dependent helicase [Marinibactrum halimedae]